MPLRFHPGRLLITPGASALLEASGVFVFSLLARHLTGDWGDVSKADAAENELSLIHGFRLLSAYTLKSGQRVWIITEADRSATTILLPDEY